MSTISFTPVFRQNSSVISPPKTPKSQGEILKERNAKDAEKAREKPLKERTVSDHVSIGMDKLNKLSNVPVIHADSPQKLNCIV